MPGSTPPVSHPDAAPASISPTAQLRAWGKIDAKGQRLTGWLGIAEGACIIGFAWGLSHAVSDLFDQPQTVGAVALPLSVLLLSLVLRAVFGLLNQRLAATSARRIVRGVRMGFMAQALDGRIDSVRHQVRLNALFEDTEALEGYYARFQQSGFQARILPLLLLAVMAAVSPVSAGILALTLLPFVALMALLGMSSAEESKRQLDALSRLSNLFVDRLRALPLILAFQNGPRQVRATARAAHDVAERTLRVLKVAFVTSAVLEFFSALSVALIAVYCGFYLLGQLPFEVPELLAFPAAFFVLALAPEVYAPMRRLAAAYHDRQTAFTAATRLMALDILPERTAGPALVEAPEISYSDVVCGFPDDPGMRIGPVSFTAAPGQVIALKGPTGSGKTTLLRLLLGREPISGEVKINGGSPGDISQSVAWVSQNPPILAGTLLENLKLSNQMASPNDIKKAIDLFQLKTVVITRNEALNERGSGLSGGERRRIGLARAWLKQSPIVVLDEPTADLDAEAETMLIADLSRLFAGRTVILSSHSPRVCALADQVVELA